MRMVLALLVTVTAGVGTAAGQGAEAPGVTLAEKLAADLDDMGVSSRSWRPAQLL